MTEPACPTCQTPLIDMSTHDAMRLFCSVCREHFPPLETGQMSEPVRTVTPDRDCHFCGFEMPGDGRCRNGCGYQPIPQKSNDVQLTQRPSVLGRIKHWWSRRETPRG